MMGAPGASIVGTWDVDTMHEPTSTRTTDTFMAEPLACLLSAASAHPSVSTGKERESESGLDYFGARYYGSALERWTSPDRPQVDQHADAPQSWNLYPYVRNDPLRFIGPMGTTLTVSQGWDQAQQDLCGILGGNQCADRISQNEKTGVFTADLAGIEVSENAGASNANQHELPSACSALFLCVPRVG